MIDHVWRERLVLAERLIRVRSGGTFTFALACALEAVRHAVIATAKSARNLPRAKVLQSEGLNVYDVLDHDTLVLTRATVETVTARLKQEAKEGAAS